MISRLLSNIERSPTAYHAVKRAEEILIENGFMYLSERDMWKIAKEGRYFCMRNDSSLIAFTVGDHFAFNIVAAHTDSPCLKLKGSPDMLSAGVNKLNAEVYGGPILSSWLDRRLSIAGRAYYAAENGGVRMKLIDSAYNVVIPSVAIHLNREVNNGYKFNPQIDLCPVTGLGKGDIRNLIGDALSYDLFVVCAEKGYTFGTAGEFISSPRLDDLEGVFGALEAFTESAGKRGGINVLALLDNEEVGSGTRQGAGSTYLREILKRIAYGLNKTKEETRLAFAGSMLISLDNAHAKHPNHPELSDPTSETLLGGGIAIKNHANYNYTTDALSSALIKKLFDDNGVKRQDFYMRSDLRCGSTLGAVSSGKLSVTAVDIGLPQLAMHSAVETAAASDYMELIKGLKAFYTNFIL